ncbi:DUF418 domain-containing protein [Paenibacillus chitinolyticus]|uniref:DUF418 domain-containing protein n=1 Tax=Paenibacillus chitinolyticus TaxID=79263 RepID=UPI003638C7A3
MIGPSTGNERIIALDIIRGFALLGIFLVNMPTFSGSEFAVYHGADRWLRLLFDLFVQGKFYLIFSFLFGLGFYIFMSRAEQKGFGPGLFRRRLLALLLIGFLHLALFWRGDILTLYAITGFLLPVFYRMKTETVRKWGLLLALSYLLLILGLPALIVALVAYAKGGIDPSLGGPLYTEAEAAASLHAFRTLSWPDWLAWHWRSEVWDSLSSQLSMLPVVLGMFLLGLAAGRSGLLHDVSAHRERWRKIRSRGLALSLPLLAAIAAIYAIGAETDLSLVTFFLVYMSGFTLAFVYIACLALLLENPLWQRRLRFLQPYGRMALTNYLSQTVLCVVLFLGFRLYGQVNLWQGTLLCLVIYPLQIAFSAFWLKRFRYGPVEWLWRKWTYGRLSPGRGQSR